MIPNLLPTCLVCLAQLLSACGPKTTTTTSTQPAMSTPAYRPSPLREPTRKQKLHKLLLREGTPTEQELRDLGSAVDSDLTNLINSRTTSDDIRVKAVVCMGYFQNKRSRLLLRSVLTDPSWQKPFRLAALMSIARSQGMEAFNAIKEYSLDADADMRLAAVKALVVIGGREALNLLKALQLSERNPDVLEGIDGGIRSLGSSIFE